MSNEKGGTEEAETPKVRPIPPVIVPPVIVPPEIIPPEDGTQESEPEEGEPEPEEETPIDETHDTALLHINELRTELSIIDKRAEYIEFKIMQAGNLHGISLYIMYEAQNPFIYKFPDITVMQGEYITLHLQTFENGCADELGDNLSLSRGNDSCPTARDLWVSDTAELLHKTDIVYLKNENGIIIDAVILNENPGKTWNSNQAHFAEIMDNLFNAGMWKSANGQKPTPLDAVNTSTIGTNTQKGISRYEGRENTHSAAETIDKLYSIVKEMPRLGDTVTVKNPAVYLHYFTGTADYFICEYDGEDTMFGKVRFKMYHPDDNTGYRKFSLSNLKSNQFLELDFGWVVSPVSR